MVEILVVVAILTILTALALAQYQRFAMRARRSEGIAILSGFHLAAMAYYSSESRFPSHMSYGMFPAEIGFAPASPPKFYRVHDIVTASPQYVPGFLAEVGQQYSIILFGQLDSDPAWDALCIAYPRVNAWVGCPEGNPGQVNGVPGFDDERN